MKRETGATLKYLCGVAGKEKAYIFALLAVQTILGASGILYALLLRNIIDAAVGKLPDVFLYYVLTFAALTLLQICLRALLRHLDELSRANLENRFKARLYSVLFSKSYGEVSAVHSAEWMNELTTDTVIVADGLTGILPGFAGMLIRLIGAVCALLVLEPRFAYLIIPGGILLVLFSWLFRKKMKKLHKNVRESDGGLRTTLQEGLSNMLVVRSYAAEEEIEKNAFAGMAAHKGARMKRVRFSNLANIGFGIMMSGAYVVGVAFCGHGILTGVMTYGTLMAVMQLIAQVQAPLANISGFLPRFYSMTASAERLAEAEKLEEQRAENALTAGEIRNFYENDFSGLGFDEVGFCYSEGEAAVLTDFSLYIKKGGCTAFTGISGCGKSTALKLLLGLYKVKRGKVYISCREGNEITDILKYQRLFAYVPQGNYLMTGTIREVVSFADRSRMDDENKLREALEIACADEFVNNLETGVNAVLGERGAGLSEGQAQRLAIARAIFSERPVLLLDECTSALDEATERKLLDNLREMTDKTVIIVTHRPAALEICDSVVEFTDSDSENIMLD